MRTNSMDWILGGVDSSLAGHGGDGCYHYRSWQRKVLESAGLLTSTVGLIVWCIRRIRRKKEERAEILSAGANSVTWHKQLILVFVCLMFGVQVGFKLCSRCLIFLLQPCHLTTTTQIYLLAAPHNNYTNIIFRLHAGFLNGGLLAILFPVLDIYTLPFELEMYWIQHSVMLMIPLYLMQEGYPFTLEEFSKFDYSILSYATFMLYHITILQPVSFATGVNINNVLCPAYSDPFAGENYILTASFHQLLLIVLIVKVLRVVQPLLQSANNKAKQS